MISTTIAVAGMSCGSCAKHVEKAVLALPGIHTARVDLAEASVLVEYEDAAVSQEAIAKAIEDAGYQPSL